MIDLKEALSSVGVQPGEILMVHSRLFGPGLLPGIEPKDYASTYLKTFQEVLGETGTLVVPSYTTSFGRVGKPFHLETSPSEMGVFSECVRQQEGSQRTLHPIQSVTAIGSQAYGLTHDHPRWNVGADTIWDRLLQKRASVLSIGLPLHLCLSFVHQVEFLACVPYVYHKVLRGEVHAQGKRVEGDFFLAARYLNRGVAYGLARRFILDLSPWMTTVRFGLSVIQHVPLEAVYRVCMAGLRNDPYYLLKEPPTFTSGEIPLDGVTKEREEPVVSYFQKGE
ncbi:MAG: AAC(3) family N-acetyltransferase [Candidatus Omnitrophota bacterium]|nr:AAC(3) family N-acetyltransferase [Candidatus Omnitrophota bacterium]